MAQTGLPCASFMHKTHSSSFRVQPPPQRTASDFRLLYLIKVKKAFNAFKLILPRVVPSTIK